MSENVKADRSTSPPAGSVSESTPLDVSSSASGVEHRLDGPHPQPLSSEALGQDAFTTDQAFMPDQPPTAGMPVDAASDDRPGSDAAGGPSRDEEELLLQASQIAGHLRERFAELDRREQSLNARLSELDQESRNFRLWVHQSEEEINEREGRLKVCEAELAQQLEAAEKLAGELEEQQQRLARDKEELAAQRAKLRDEVAAEFNAERTKFSQEQAEWTEHRQQEIRQIKQRKQEIEQRLADERQKLQQQQEEHRQEIAQERTLHEKRIRFQQDHLQKTRQELEIAYKEFRLDEQQARLRLEQAENSLRLRQVQLHHYRELLEEREQSVQREYELLSKAGQLRQDEEDRGRQQLIEDRQAWETERETQRAEFRKQQQTLASQSENFESRRVRLDRLRAELEETHRNTLEMRMAVEEAWAQLSQATGDDSARCRVDEARQALSSHFSQLRESLADQLQELGEAQALFQRQKDEFRKERQSVADWAAQRDDTLRQRDEQLRQQSEALETREAVWREARSKWLQEKIQAEEVIRDLLRQLTDANEACSEHRPQSVEPSPAVAEDAQTTRATSEPQPPPPAHDATAEIELPQPWMEAVSQEPEPVDDQPTEPPAAQQPPDSEASAAVTQAEIERRILESILPADTSLFNDPRD